MSDDNGRRHPGLIAGIHVLLPGSVVVRLLKVIDRGSMTSDPVLAQWLPSLVAVAQRWHFAVESSDLRTPAIPTTEPAPSSEWVTVAQAAALLDLGERRVLALIHTGTLPATKRGRVWWIQRTEVELLIENRRIHG
ncbi:helix-turn-helix domain-containing protein [Microbacterium sp. KSW2-21]|uniref:Helix-turn-helix domain-containing protein n=1 Tax=Microbacterium algihabitans TaxID=3075992 RepID=A0ABU3RWH0_9MICO|nr:helix-turn-helix domain-containing protein [Microbacterium sp. KSW2-21]MDU0327216.1 helix-turn-helix domain-containing protein [Microbacterium sp. KSW2-21]